jgi:hypothetical protein
MKEKTPEQRFKLWKQRYPNGTIEDFEEHSRIVRNKFRTRNSILTNLDGTVIINPTVDDIPDPDENRDIAKICDG